MQPEGALRDAGQPRGFPPVSIAEAVAGVTPASRVDFAERAQPAKLPEWMDGACSYEEFRDCVRDLRSVNRWTLGYRPTLKFLEGVVRSQPARRAPWRILDVGAGGGDGLRRIARWARRRGVAVELTGIDLNPHAMQAAEEFSRGDSQYRSIRWVTGDVFTEPAAQGCDLVLSSLVTHHMQNEQIAEFLRWMEATAGVGWFVNDLLRSANCYRLFQLLAKAMRWHPFVQHDGPVSIRRGFRKEDWRRLLVQAEVPWEAVALQQLAPGRLCLSRVR